MKEIASRDYLASANRFFATRYLGLSTINLVKVKKIIIGIAVYTRVMNYQSSFIMASRAMIIYPIAQPIERTFGASCLMLSLVVSVKYMIQALK